MFGIEIAATYKGLKGEQFAWEVELHRAGKTFTAPYSAGFAHCKPVYPISPKGPREKVTQKMARALKPFGALSVDDVSGYVEPTAPTLTRYLECLQLDARSGEHLLFEDFADEFGYDLDSRKAEKIWRACQQTRGELQKFLAEDFGTFINTNFDEDVQVVP